MVQIGLLLTYQYKLLSLAAILDVFETVNRLYKESGEPAPFGITLLHAGATEHSAANTFFRHPAMAIQDSPTPDLILIPSFTTEDYQQTLQNNRVYIPWLQEQYKAGAEIAAFCTGALLMGASGLLNGKTATTHVDISQQFSRLFPAVKLRADKTVVRDGRLYTSGGATSSFHLLLHLLQIHCGVDIAVRTAKIFSIDMGRDKQSYFSTFRPSRSHSDDLVATAQQKIEMNYQEKSTIEEIIRDIPSSRRNIVRRFKQVTGITPIEYLQQTRIEAAKKLLEQTGQQMTEIIINSGYNDLKSFRRIFRKTVGMTPSEYREKFKAIH